LAYLETEPLVRVLWVPQLNCRVQRWLGALGHRGLGHPIGAPIRICFAQILRGSVFEPAKLRSRRWSMVWLFLLLSPWAGTRGSKQEAQCRYCVFACSNMAFAGDFTPETM
jgi:hypothetical protein